MTIPVIVTLKRLFSFLSLLGSLIIMATFYVAPKWQYEFKDAKQMLFVLSIYTTVATFGFFLVAPTVINDQCKFQASVIQWFGIGSAIYDALLSVESKLQIDAIIRGVPQKYDEYYFKPRHYIYHIVVFMYGMITVIWMLASDNIGLHYFVGAKQGAQCWIQNSLDLMLLSLIPVWVSLGAIIYCNASIMVNFFRTTKGGLVITLTPRTKCMIYRLVAIPIFALLVWLPATILRITDYYATVLDGQSVLDYIWICTFASSGIYNCITYVFMDRSVLKAWRVALWNLRQCKNFQGQKLVSTSFDGPVSTYGSAPAFNSYTSSSDAKKSTAYSSTTSGQVSVSMVDVYGRGTTVSQDDRGSNASVAIYDVNVVRPSSVEVNIDDTDSKRLGAHGNRDSGFSFSGRDSIIGRMSLNWASKPGNDLRDTTTFTTIRESVSSSSVNSTASAKNYLISSAIKTNTGSSAPSEPNKGPTSTAQSTSIRPMPRPSISTWYMGLSPSSLAALASSSSSTPSTVSSSSSSSATPTTIIENPVLSANDSNSIV